MFVEKFGMVAKKFAAFMNIYEYLHVILPNFQIIYHFASQKALPLLSTCTATYQGGGLDPPK